VACARAPLYHVKAAARALVVAEHHLCELFKSISVVAADDPELCGRFTSYVSALVSDVSAARKELEELSKLVEGSELIRKLEEMERRERELSRLCEECAKGGLTA